ncbi:hypothetical protein Hypma_010906 [Hypsizygus marmoreus]|uniref:Uncharacterized protein n=1 Tax=Hypsizygus marmoreus TaxID=39966 RepID=A0A369JQW2_HYPMA|nr:hypothetical protein Hypma_010906 [Hypsizygus marmoreus]
MPRILRAKTLVKNIENTRHTLRIYTRWGSYGRDQGGTVMRPGKAPTSAVSGPRAVVPVYVDAHRLLTVPDPTAQPTQSSWLGQISECFEPIEDQPSGDTA